jgi:hypothetical protein
MAADPAGAWEPLTLEDPESDGATVTLDAAAGLSPGVTTTLEPGGAAEPLTVPAGVTVRVCSCTSQAVSPAAATPTNRVLRSFIVTSKCCVYGAVTEANAVRSAAASRAPSGEPTLNVQVSRADDIVRTDCRACPSPAGSASQTCWFHTIAKARIPAVVSAEKANSPTFSAIKVRSPENAHC